MYLIPTLDVATGDVAKIYSMSPDSSTPTLLAAPSGFRGWSLKPQGATYRGTTIMTGFGTDAGLAPISYLFATNRYYFAGIAKPASAPTLAASGAGITGIAIGYVTFRQKYLGQILQESDPSTGSNTLTLTNQGRAWSGLPTSDPSGRATHVVGYVSMDGDVPQETFEIAIGSSTHTENVATDARGVTLPVTTAGDVDTGARGVPPAARWCIVYHDRTWYAMGNTVYYSRLFEPESVNIESALKTRGGEIITGMGVSGDQLVLFSATAMDVVQGYGTGDFTVHRVSTDVGCISGLGIANVDGTLMFPSQQGACAYAEGAGKPRNLMSRSWRKAWQREYALQPAAYETSVGHNDVQGGNYMLLLTMPASPKSVTFVGYYRAMTELGQAEPYWSRDYQARKCEAIGRLYVSGTSRPITAFGAADGYLRIEDATDPGDDNDALLKAWEITHAHMLFGDQTGDGAHARTFEGLDLFCLNNTTVVDVAMFCGDEDALSGVPQWTDTVPASASTGYVAKTSHHLTVDGAAGKGCTVRFSGANCVGYEHRGYAVHYLDGGEQTRPPVPA